MIFTVWFYHFYPCSSYWNKLAFLDIELNLGEETWVPALHPVELLGLKQNTGKKAQEGHWNPRSPPPTPPHTNRIYLGTGENKVWVFLHQADNCHPASPTFTNGLLIWPQPSCRHTSKGGLIRQKIEYSKILSPFLRSVSWRKCGMEYYVIKLEFGGVQRHTFQ